jgi:hypothetical protein
LVFQPLAYQELTARKNFPPGSNPLSRVSFLPGISAKAAKKIRQTIRDWRMASTRNNQRLEDLAHFTNPVVRGWLNYYGRYYRSKCAQVLRHFNEALGRWVQRKYKRFKRRERASMHWLGASRDGTPSCLSRGNKAYDRRLGGKSRMTRERPVRFCEGGGVRFLSATRPVLGAFLLSTSPAIPNAASCSAFCDRCHQTLTDAELEAACTRILRRLLPHGHPEPLGSALP